MPEPGEFCFARPQHDRRSELRPDDARVEAAWADPESRVLIVGARHIAMNGADPLLPPADAPEGERLYLGEARGRSYFAVVVDDVAEGLGPRTLRECALELPDFEAGLVVHAVGIANWHRTHRFCARCGAASMPAQGGHTRVCTVCEAQHFPRTDPAVIMLITDADDRALLGRQPSWPRERYSTLAGFVEPGETLEQAVRREVAEETGVRVGDVRYAASQPWPFPSSLMLGFFGDAETLTVQVDQDEIEQARWFSRDEVAELSASGELALPGAISISRWLIDRWHGGTITGAWT